MGKINSCISQTFDSRVLRTLNSRILHVLRTFNERIIHILDQYHGVWMGFSVICPYFLVFTAKLAIFLMFTVLEKNTVAFYKHLTVAFLRTFNSRILRTFNSRILRTFNGRLLRTYNGLILRTLKSRILPTFNSRFLLTFNERIMHLFNGRILRTFNGRLLRTFNSRLLGTYNSRILRTLNGRVYETFNERVLRTFNGHILRIFNRRIIHILDQYQRVWMGFSVLCPYFLVFTVKLAIFLMFTVLEKKYCLGFERRPQSLFSISNFICPFKFCKKISREQWAKAEMFLSLEPIVRLIRPSVLGVLKGIRLVIHAIVPEKYRFWKSNQSGVCKRPIALEIEPQGKYWC